MSQKALQEGVHTFVFLPFAEYKAMDTRLKKAESAPSDVASHHEHLQSSVEESSVEREAPKELDRAAVKKKDLAASYRSSHLKKLLKHLEKVDNNGEILNLENLDALIKSAFSNSKKILRNEETFFKYLFSNGLSHWVSNRNKIDLYHPEKDSWFKI